MPYLAAKLAEMLSQAMSAADKALVDEAIRLYSLGKMLWADRRAAGSDAVSQA